MKNLFIVVALTSLIACDTSVKQSQDADVVDASDSSVVVDASVNAPDVVDSSVADVVKAFDAGHD